LLGSWASHATTCNANEWIGIDVRERVFGEILRIEMREILVVSAPQRIERR